MSRVVVVTDSTASLPAEVARARGIRVVPLQVVIGAKVLDEGPDGATPDVVAQALRDFVPVSTSRPAPMLFADLYRELESAGVEEIVSVHLSGEMSGTFESAQLAALEVELPVHVVDSGQVGIATGYAALSAVDELAAILTERLSDGLEGREVMCGELGAVLGAHVGPGMVAVCVAPRP